MFFITCLDFLASQVGHARLYQVAILEPWWIFDLIQKGCTFCLAQLSLWSNSPCFKFHLGLDRSYDLFLKSKPICPATFNMHWLWALPFWGTFLALHKLLNLIIRQLRHNALGGLGCLESWVFPPPHRPKLPWCSFPPPAAVTCQWHPTKGWMQKWIKMVTCGRLRLRKGIRKDPSSSRVIMSLTWNCILNIAGAKSMMSCNRVISSSAAALLPAPAPGKRNCLWDSFLFVCDHSSWI